MIPEKLSDQTVINVAEEFTDNRFPVATWRNHRNGATLLRSASFHTVWKRLSKHPSALLPALHGGKVPFPPDQQDKRQLEMRNAQVESLMKSIVEVTPSFCKRVASPSVSSLSDGVVPMGSALQKYWEEANSDCSQEDTAVGLPVGNKSEESDDDDDDDRMNSEEEEEMTEMSDTGDKEGMKVTLDSTVDISDKDHEPPKQRQPTAGLRRLTALGLAAGEESKQSPVKFSAMPTAPSDWVTMDLLPNIIRTWKPSPLYIIGDKDKLKVSVVLV